MLKKPIMGIFLFLTVVSLSTAGYLSRQGFSHQYFGGYVSYINEDDLQKIHLFNPSAEFSIQYSLFAPKSVFNGRLAPLESKTFDANGSSTIKLLSTSEILAWLVSHKVEKGQELSRNTAPFFDETLGNSRMLFPWIQANTGSSFESGYITVYNTEDFSANINYFLYDEETSALLEQRFMVIPPTTIGLFPAATLHSGPEAPRYGEVLCYNFAHLLSYYTGPRAQGTYSYWSLPTASFSSSFAPFFDSKGPVQDSPFALTAPFSSDHLLYQNDSVSSLFRSMRHEVTGPLQGEAQVDIVQKNQSFTLPLVGSTPAPISLSGSDLAPGPGHHSGTVGMQSYNFDATSLSVYTSNTDRSAATPVVFQGRAVFPVDGREPWNDQLSASAFVFNNKSGADLPLAIALLDENGSLLDVSYPILAPGASEIPVSDFVNSFPDTRILLVESGQTQAVLTLHLMVFGTGEGFGQMVDYIAPANSPGCATVGLGPENYYNWGSNYELGCDKGVASVKGLVEQINLGRVPPYND